jgi:hypothetical protein
MTLSPLRHFIRMNDVTDLLTCGYVEISPETGAATIKAT